MSYAAVIIYDLDGNFVGYGIKGDQFKLQSANLYHEDEKSALQERLNELNADVDLRAYWPNPKDPEVLALVNNPEFFPIEYIMAEVVDDDRSYYVWEQEPETDEYGNQVVDPVTGNPRMIQGANLDRDASVINYKMAQVPKNPSDQMLRIKAACEVIARQRAGLT